MVNYNRARATADRLITKNGKPATLRVVHPDQEQTDNWDPQPDTPTDYPIKVVELDYTLRERESTLVLQGDKKLLVAVGTLPVEPSSADSVVLNGREYTIINVSPFAPGPVTVFYEMQVR